jgi:DNA mismatch endonuclease (patch repair protein)
LPGCPDIVFTRPKLAIFCDGDFWHGKDWKVRRRKLGRGTNSDYWLAKIKRNIERDRKTTRQLQEMGWKVMRFWESQILADPSGVAQEILGALDERSPGDDLLKGS